MLSFAVPVMAMPEIQPPATVEEATLEITPFIEETRLYWRTYGGVLQFRVWGMTSARWLTDWTDVGAW